MTGPGLPGAAVGVDDFPETAARLEEEVDDALFTRGAQVAVTVDGVPSKGEIVDITITLEGLVLGP